MKKLLIFLISLIFSVNASASLDYYHQNSFIETRFLDSESCKTIKEGQYICPKGYTKKYPESIIEEMKKEITAFELDETDYESVLEYNKLVDKYKKILKETEDDIAENCVKQNFYCKAFTCEQIKPWTVYYKETNSCLCQNGNPYNTKYQTCLTDAGYKDYQCKMQKYGSYYSSTEDTCLCLNGNDFTKWCTDPFIEQNYVYALALLWGIFLVLVIIQFIVKKVRNKKEV